MKNDQLNASDALIYIAAAFFTFTFLLLKFCWLFFVVVPLEVISKIRSNIAAQKSE